ncbi:DUF192 domain-containing protein [Schinkia sp. CFF1]
MMNLKLLTATLELELPIKIERYDTFWNRFRGLMFRLKPIIGEGILIDPCNSIHMFFMFFPIDVVFVNKIGEIIYMKENVKPWSVIWPVKHAKSVLELPVGTIVKYGIKVGNRVNNFSTYN